MYDQELQVKRFNLIFKNQLSTSDFKGCNVMHQRMVHTTNNLFLKCQKNKTFVHMLQKQYSTSGKIIRSIEFVTPIYSLRIYTPMITRHFPKIIKFLFCPVHFYFYLYISSLFFFILSF